MSTTSAVTFGIGVAAFFLSLIREWIAGRERRRARPVVICHQHKRRVVSGGEWIVGVYLTNESAATAFNVRFGVNPRRRMGGLEA